MPIADSRGPSARAGRRTSLVLTSLTTLLAVGIMYGAGGSGIRPFTFCLLIGLVVGTYSSVAIAAPLVFKSASTDPSSADTKIEPFTEEPGAATA